jgi:hypothetical protein
VEPQKATGFWHWIRLHGFDWWQVFGLACLVIGVLGFGVLIVNVRPSLPRTNGAFLLQTVIGGSHVSAAPQADASPSPSPSPDPTGVNPSATGPQPSASRSGVFWVRPSASAAPTSGTVSPTASASVAPTATDTATPRPTIPVPSVSPTPTPRPTIH